MGNRKAAIISSRVHPGETPASWMMKGVIDFATSDTEEAKQLREQYVLKIVPMLNPDGVINGNYRCSLSGFDLNRKWDHPEKSTFPVIHHMKKVWLQNTL